MTWINAPHGRGAPCRSPGAVTYILTARSPASATRITASTTTPTTNSPGSAPARRAPGDPPRPMPACSRRAGALTLYWNAPLQTGVMMELCPVCDGARPTAAAFIRWHRDPDRDPQAVQDLFEAWEEETLNAHGWFRAADVKAPPAAPLPPGPPPPRTRLRPAVEGHRPRPLRRRRPPGAAVGSTAAAAIATVSEPRGGRRPWSWPPPLLAGAPWRTGPRRPRRPERAATGQGAGVSQGDVTGVWASMTA